jgi:NAD(P)H-hydrate repair Nnr-like enzyme with NAD(P)H-hydrate dehydratase domain
VSPESAALLGVWLHGKSGDLYAKEFCEESLTATSLIDFICPAIKSLGDKD